MCHLKNSELKNKLQKVKGRVVLTVDIVKNDSMNYAVFTEQGASASHMTAAKSLGRYFQDSDAVSAYTQVSNRIVMESPEPAPEADHHKNRCQN